VDHVELVEEFLLPILKELLIAYCLFRPATPAHYKNVPEHPFREQPIRVHFADRFPAFPDIHNYLVCVAFFDFVSFQVALELVVVFVFGAEVQGCFILPLEKLAYP